MSVRSSITEPMPTGKVPVLLFFYLLEETAWNEVKNDAIRMRLQRYIDESRNMRYGGYFGSERTATVVYHDGNWLYRTTRS